MKIMIVEDDTALQRGLSLRLSKEGYDVKSAENVKTSLLFIEENKFDIAIIDINLPDGNGLDICKKIREISHSTYILFLTANDSEIDILMGYDYGADDYITKPFSVSVLLSKCNVIKRRKENNLAGNNFFFDVAKQTVTISDRVALLTRNETRLMNVFLENKGNILSKDKLLYVLWDIDEMFVDENTLAVNIRRLREKIEADPSNPVFIETVRGTGYRFRGDL